MSPPQTPFTSSSDKWLSRLGVQSLFLWYRPTERSTMYVDDRTDEIEDEQDYTPSLCPKVPTVQLF